MAANATIKWVLDTNVILELVFASTSLYPIEIVVLDAALQELKNKSECDDESVKKLAIKRLKRLEVLRVNPLGGLTVTFDKDTFRFSYGTSMDSDITMLLIAEGMEPTIGGSCCGIPWFRFLTSDRYLRVVVLQRNRVCRSHYDCPADKEFESLGLRLEPRAGQDQDSMGRFNEISQSNPSKVFKLFDMAALLAMPGDFEATLEKHFKDSQVVIPFHTVADCDNHHKNLNKRMLFELDTADEDFEDLEEERFKMGTLRRNLWQHFLKYPYASPVKRSKMDHWTGKTITEADLPVKDLDDAMLQAAYRKAMEHAVQQNSEAAFFPEFIANMERNGVADMKYQIHVRKALADVVIKRMQSNGMVLTKGTCDKGIVEFKIGDCKIATVFVHVY